MWGNVGGSSSPAQNGREQPTPIGVGCSALVGHGPCLVLKGTTIVRTGFYAARIIYRVHFPLLMLLCI